jgi:SAM-dependent methyltransferase
MGLLFSDTKMLWQARQGGASFDATLTVGHQQLFLHPSEVKYFQKVASSQEDLDSRALRSYRFADYADNFLREFLKVTSLSILDNSPYEGATLIHDLNYPVPEDLWNKFDAVIDAGSLEHIFNFPVAIGSLMRMAKVGGKIFISTPANNLCGHGFYQFSPELMFRVFSKQNGFRLERIVLVPSRFPEVQYTSKRIGYVVTDPAIVRTRVGLMSKSSITMMVEATKIQDSVALSTPPQQSDYEVLWKQEGTVSQERYRANLKAIFHRLPHFLQMQIRGYYQRSRYSFSNSSFYRRIRI